MKKKDPWKHREKYERWKKKVSDGIPDVREKNSEIILEFLNDMAIGRNTGRGTKKGARSYARLNNLRQRLVFMTRKFEERYDMLLTEMTDREVHDYFGGMRSGAIRRLDGKRYRSTGDYVNVFKTFWHWHMKVERKEGRTVPDITLDLDYSSEKADWVYLTREDVENLCRHAKFKYKVLMLFIFDSGIRSPTELMNVRVQDLSKDCTQVKIRDEAAKTFGRTIKLLLSGDHLRQYIDERELRAGDFVFSFNPLSANRYLKRLAKRVLGTSASPGGKTYDKLTMYDFRHSSACYWLPRYKSESALKYRFGWKRSKMIEYYTGFLGMRDTITKDDLLIDEKKTEVEQKLAKTEREKAVLEEKMQAMDRQMKEILETVSGLTEKAA